MYDVTRGVGAARGTLVAVFLATVKVLLWTTLCLALSALVIGKGIAALRRGEPYRFGFLDGGLVGQGKEADPRIVIGGALAYLLASPCWSGRTTTATARSATAR